MTRKYIRTDKHNGKPYRLYERADGHQFYEPPMPEARHGGLDEILATRRFPATHTDRELALNLGGLEEQFAGCDPAKRQRAIEVAKSLGYNDNCSYEPFMARDGFDFDPEAFVPHVGARGHVRRVCERRGTNASGPGIEVKAYRQPETDPFEDDGSLPEALIEEEIAARVLENPELRHEKTYQEVREQVLDDHAPKV
jgi:hypothetical protein